jgi:hypothetical protein
MLVKKSLAHNIQDGTSQQSRDTTKLYNRLLSQTIAI